jgi:hypothetical protein
VSPQKSGEYILSSSKNVDDNTLNSIEEKNRNFIPDFQGKIVIIII